MLCARHGHGISLAGLDGNFHAERVVHTRRQRSCGKNIFVRLKSAKRRFQCDGLAMLPPLILFLVFQRQIIRGIALTGLKG